MYARGPAKLKEDVKIMLNKGVDPLNGLVMIDDLQRLGVFYHFEDEIKRVLEKVFKNFMDKTRHFKAFLGEDIGGMLYLYEASYLSFRDESILEEARDFANRNLERNLKGKDIDQDNALLVSHALELPLHWRMPRLEARWFIDLYERRLNMNPTLLQLAKLDFNIVQATHQEDLKHMLRNVTVINALITTIDDVYDVYGTLDELEIFTNAVERLVADEMKRGDNPKSIQCYMYETGASEEDARKYIKYLIGETWKKMNEDRFKDCPFSQTLVEVAMNFARMYLSMYQYGDGHATQGRETKDRVLSLLINPIPLEY
ncbi:hypothetical protein Vadar_024992 [Vaccinium darrowii]|uniref:Uncharacterized protein n=1 Tax=Vaccinium darrowii TaxID=229202 RepID=A0ACB7YQI0_9ERIC|nr:hypothetical protein Vadar_024992 [Vaccinium darrowii]